MYMPWSPGTVPRYMLRVMVGAGSGWRRGEVHGVEQGGSWCSHRGWSMPYGVTCTAKGPTARWSLWGWMLLRRATARVWERPSLIHTASARDAAGFRQSVMMPVIVRLWVASDTLAGGGADAGDGVVVVTRSRGGPATGRCGTRASEQAGKALRSQGHQCAHVM